MVVGLKCIMFGEEGSVDVNVVKWFVYGYGGVVVKLCCVLQDLKYVMLVVVYSECGVFDDYLWQVIVVVVVFVDVQMEVVLFVFGELKDDVVEFGVDKLIELVGFECCVFDFESEL